MSVNNFDVVERELLKFEELTDDNFYKFVALVRGKDNPENPILCGKKNGNVLIKSWFINSKGRYNKVKPEMVALCNCTGARLYITCDAKSTSKVLYELLEKSPQFVPSLLNSQLSLKKLTNIINSITSSAETTAKGCKTYTFDIDGINEENAKHNLERVKRFLSEEEKYIVLKTVNGYHVVTKIRQEKVELWEDLEASRLLLSYVSDIVKVVPNQLALVYYPN